MNLRGLVVTVDIRKAFDFVNHLFFNNCIIKIWLWWNIKWTQILLRNQESCIIIGGTTTNYTSNFKKVQDKETQFLLTGWPTKMSLFFGNIFYKNKEAFKIFSPQLLEVYRILLVETTLKSMFYFTLSVINTMFVSCTMLLYDSTAAIRTSKLPTTLLSISCGIRLISFLMMSSLFYE